MRNDVLEYVGLDLENLPEELESKSSIHMQNYSGSNTYKVYDYISVHDLEILITPLDRTAELKERYKYAKTLEEYLRADDQKTRRIFMDILDLATAKEIKELEELQEKLNNNIPELVKYNKNYLWQIYYSAEDNKYFMLFPANEGETSVLFYIIKKKLEKADTKIFVPINKLDYSENILSKEEINDIENYIWLFTNEWPKIYEVCNKKLYITGKTKINGIFESFFRNIYESEDKAKKFHMLLKAMFILTTETNYQYTFEPYVNEKGELELKYDGEIINVSNLTTFIDRQTEIKKEKISKLNKEIEKNRKILGELKEYVKEQNNIYVMQEKQIAMFLECKNSFFKKISYFFKVKKFTVPKIDVKIEKEDDDKNEEIEIGVACSYTIKELINISMEMNGVESKARDLRADIRELQLKKENLARKIKNASEYIAEIEEHKKSIFEFWKFTNKDALPALETGNINKGKDIKNKILGTFDLEQDLEILGTKVDSIQRQKLTRNEMDIIYAAQFCIDAINYPENNEVLERVLKKLKSKIEKGDKTDNGHSDLEELLKDYRNVKTLKNREHREVERNEITILNINKKTTVKEFRETIHKCIKILNVAFKKITSITQMPVYARLDDVVEFKNENVDNWDDREKVIIGEINPIKLLDESDEPVKLLKVPLDENTNILYYSNIIFFENQNNTLPIGMDVSTKVLMKINVNAEDYENYKEYEEGKMYKADKKEEKGEKVKREEINIFEKINDFEFKIKKVIIIK